MSIEAALLEENERLRERIAELERLLGMEFDAPPQLSLTTAEARVLGVLTQKGFATKDALMSALYWNRPDGDMPEIKIVDVFICKLRKKLTRFDLPIETVRGQGYRLTDETRQRVRNMMPKRMAA